ncbi:hypothetical protein OAD54_01110 [Candidatus Pelagibacter sp.]|nr:hypothetical protein [Candidatus Pelagibacter sp.]
MTKKQNNVVITLDLRTPTGKYKGSLKNLSADKSGAIALGHTIEASGTRILVILIHEMIR